MGGSGEHEEFEVPKEGIAGVVKNEGPNFEIEVKKVPVPEIGMSIPSLSVSRLLIGCSSAAVNEKQIGSGDKLSISLILMLSNRCLGPEDVLIKINATGLCVSDIHFMQQDLGGPPMSHYGTICAGHEGAGVIVKIGERVKTLKVGQRAGIKPVFDCCHTCDQCKSGRDNYCPNAVHTGRHVDGMIKPITLPGSA